MSTEKQITCLEFFSGIGGMHFALKSLSRLNFKILEAFDINQSANLTYFHNLSLQPRTANIEHISLEQYEKYNADCWLMSPPCQPFTRGGKELDEKDARSAGLLFLMQLLCKISVKPTYLFLENVVGFEKSACRDNLVGILKSFGYKVCEFLVTPVDPSIAIPNSRLRYYLVASRNGRALESENILRMIPFKKGSSACLLFDKEGNLSDSLAEASNYKSRFQKLKPYCFPWLPPLSDFLNTDWMDSREYEDYAIPLEYIRKVQNFQFDICHPSDCISSTFTKAYGSHHITSSGSLLQTANLHYLNYDKSNMQDVLEMKPRFFTPKEIARLHAFPESFEFPAEITKIQQYRLLGNSLNVKVVAKLLEVLFFPAEFYI